MHSAEMGAENHRELRSSGWSGSGTRQRSGKFFRLAQLRKLRGCEQVAAVCYRVRGDGVEFLLVQTRGGRWTFPKGGAEPGLTHAQAAALEAFEEAGVHGRIEEAAFAQYVRRKNGEGRRPAAEIAISAHLCEVSRLDPPQESDRNRTWLSAEKAKLRLRADRASEYGDELARVVDRAVARIQRLRGGIRIAVRMRQETQVIAIRKPR
jgi:8-oxo-dGTP pyrophosphatase MutT (NUDIX family)